jgi:hypothetical protein
VARNTAVAEHLVGEDLGQVVGAAGFRVGGQGLQVEVVGLREAEQHLGGDRPLVALQQVQVARRDAEVLGHPGLGEAEVAPQALQARAQEQLPIGGRDARHLVELSQFYRFYKVCL